MTRISGTYTAGRSPSDVRATLRAMRKNVQESIPNPIVWETARAIVSRVPPRDEIGQVRAIKAWVADHFRFVKDPLGDELLLTPTYQLQEIRRAGFVAGDCDDAAALIAAIAVAIGIPAQFYAVDLVTSPKGFDHVFTVLRPFDRATRARPPIALDVTRPKDLPPPKAFRRILVFAAV